MLPAPAAWAQDTCVLAGTCLPHPLLAHSRPLGLQRGCIQAHPLSVEMEKGKGLSFCEKEHSHDFTTAIIMTTTNMNNKASRFCAQPALSHSATSNRGGVWTGLILVARRRLREALDGFDFPPRVPIVFSVSQPGRVGPVPQPAFSLSLGFAPSLSHTLLHIALGVPLKAATAWEV